jgi:hypothetical protein
MRAVGSCRYQDSQLRIPPRKRTAASSRLKSVGVTESHTVLPLTLWKRLTNARAPVPQYQISNRAESRANGHSVGNLKCVLLP